MPIIKCQNCLEKLEIESKVTNFTCPHCKKKQTVPAGLADLPTPSISAKPGIDTVPEDTEENKNMQRLASTMPFVISAFLHGGVFLLTMFIIFLADAAAIKPIDIPIPNVNESETPGDIYQPNPSDSVKDGGVAGKSLNNNNKYVKSHGNNAMSSSPGASTGAVDIIGGVGNGNAGSGGAMGSGTDFGIGTGGSDGKPKRVNFIGSGGNFKDVVFVIDRSGSMNDSFDSLKHEMIKCISSLSQTQNFHVIFFSQGKPIELPLSCLRPATRDYRLEAASFISKGVSPEGSTDVMPALNRGFEVLKAAKGNHKLIYLLTDGQFPDDKAVLDCIKANESQKVTICTFLYGAKSDKAEETLMKIAELTGGKYKFVDSLD